MNELKLFDTVALIEDMPIKNLRRGSIGTIVEIMDSNNFLVEFANMNGEMYAMPVIGQEKLLKLYHEPVLV
jgi:hypothetical protein